MGIEEDFTSAEGSLNTSPRARALTGPGSADRVKAVYGQSTPGWWGDRTV